jgi:alpha,alpha-trehalase
VILDKKHTPITKEELGPALTHIDHYWQKLTRKSTKNNSTLIALPNPYVVPSLGNNHFAFEEQYYWDSYFTAIGIDDEKLVEGMLENLIFMFEEFGMIPNGNRYYLTSRSQPPILTTFIFHVFEKYNKSTDWLKKHIAIAKREYTKVWTCKVHPHHREVYEGLSRYYDINHLHDLAEAESGWDMTPRFKRQCLDYLPVDLNCLLYKYEADFAKAAHILNDESEEKIWHYAAESRKKSIINLMWNKRKAFFFDYNYIDKVQGNVYSLAGYYVLWAGIADEYHAKKLVMQLSKFEKIGGLSTTFGSFMYAPLFGSTKTQWAYPNGWAPLHYFATEGLEKYGYNNEAKRIAQKWLRTNNDWFHKHGEFLEKYNVVNPKLPPSDGLYPSQTGFGWTNGVFTYFANKYV